MTDVQDEVNPPAKDVYNLAISEAHIRDALHATRAAMEGYVAIHSSDEYGPATTRTLFDVLTAARTALVQAEDEIRDCQNAIYDPSGVPDEHRGLRVGMYVSDREGDCGHISKIIADRFWVKSTAAENEWGPYRADDLSVAQEDV